MRKLTLLVVVLLASLGMADLTPAEKAEVKSTLTVVENQAIAVFQGQAFQQKYFLNCTFTGNGDFTFWHTCVFENCTFNLSFARAKFLWSYIEGGTMTKFEFKDSWLHGSNVPADNMDAKCKQKDKGQPYDKKKFTDHVKKVKDKKNK